MLTIHLQLGSPTVHHQPLPLSKRQGNEDRERERPFLSLTVRVLLLTVPLMEPMADGERS